MLDAALLACLMFSARNTLVQRTRMPRHSILILARFRLDCQNALYGIRAWSVVAICKLSSVNVEGCCSPNKANRLDEGVDLCVRMCISCIFMLNVQLILAIDNIIKLNV